MPAYELELWTLEIICLLVSLKCISSFEFIWRNLSKWGNRYNPYFRYCSIEETTESFGLGFAGKVKGYGTMKKLKSLNDPI